MSRHGTYNERREHARVVHDSFRSDTGCRICGRDVPLTVVPKHLKKMFTVVTEGKRPPKKLCSTCQGWFADAMPAAVKLREELEELAKLP